jgi:hypothetical protein
MGKYKIVASTSYFEPAPCQCFEAGHDKCICSMKRNKKGDLVIRLRSATTAWDIKRTKMYQR